MLSGFELCPRWVPVSNMLYRHVFDKISTEFRGISRVFVNFAALLLLEISEALYL